MASEPKPHICPPSNATHPRDRWETLFVYSFICKFTNLRGKEGLETPMDFEEALMAKEPHPILAQVLLAFVLNLKPQTRNLSADQISVTVLTVLAEYFKTAFRERTAFWSDEHNRNVDPFEGSQIGFFTSDWDTKLKILRVLVDLQLTHAPSIKSTIDRAWGVLHNKHKKGQAPEPKPDPADPKSQENLQFLPLGQDSSRKRYWATDESPRLYVSTNPWKISATVQTVSSTRDEYVALVERLKGDSPKPPKRGQKLNKLESGHLKLVEVLESRIENIDAELARVARVRKRAEQRRTLLAQAELRETRTRKRTQRPDYNYGQYDSEDDGDEYMYQDDEESSRGSRRRQAAPAATRRSGRNTTKQESDPWQDWRGERRSTRLGAPAETQLDDTRASKRARTEESTVSSSSQDISIPPVMIGESSSGVKIKNTGAAALKSTEMAVEAIPGKKKSRFWVYAVEPVVDSAAEDLSSPVDGPPSGNEMIDASKNDGITSESNTAVDEAEFDQTNGKMDYSSGIDENLSAMVVDRL